MHENKQITAFGKIAVFAAFVVFAALPAVYFIVPLIETDLTRTSEPNRCGCDGTADSCKTVSIGGQTWMAENLNYQTNRGSWCYNDAQLFCKKYGRLYNWEAATAACPKGWRLPSLLEWESLVTATGEWRTAAKKLKSKKGWDENGNGTDDFGFSALPGGYRNYYNPGRSSWFRDVGGYGKWWTATENGADNAYSRGMSYQDGNVTVGFNYEYKIYGYSVRCVADK